MPRLARFAQGVDQYPDRAATLLLQVPSLEGGPAVTLSGPGIRDTAVIAPFGLPEWFWNDWRLNAAQFPLGVDIFLTCGEAVVGLPRSIRSEEHTSELQSLMRISYAVFCLKKKKTTQQPTT